MKASWKPHSRQSAFVIAFDIITVFIMATQFGTGATFGLTTQTGIISDASTWNYVQQKKVIMDADGDPTASTYYGEGIEGTLSGYLPTTTPFSTTLAASATISDTPTDFLVGAVGSVSIVENVSITKSNEDYIRIEVGFSNFAGIT
jgi:hypothetical protein